MDLKMEVYDTSLELLGILEAFDSVLWEEYAFKAGSFSVVSLLTAENLELLKADRILLIEEKTSGIIEYIEESADESGNERITVKGRLLTGILDRRILWGRYSVTGPPAALMKMLVRDNATEPTRGGQGRVIPGLIIGSGSDSGSSIQKQKTGGGLLDALEDIGGANLVAFGVRMDAEKLQMVFWTRRSTNRTVNQSVNEPVLYSTEMDDVLASEYEYNSAGFRNVSLVAGEGEGAQRIYASVIDGAATLESDPTNGTPYTARLATQGDIQEAIFDSWEASY